MSTDKTKTHYTFKITKDGKQYQLKVNPEKLNQFFLKYPNAILVSSPQDMVDEFNKTSSPIEERGNNPNVFDPDNPDASLSVDSDISEFSVEGNEPTIIKDEPKKEDTFKEPLYACFVSGTLIDMFDGSTKEIQDIKEGDLVKSFKDSGYVSGKVTKKLVYEINDVMPVAILEGITGSIYHPVLINNEWIELGEAPIEKELDNMFIDTYYNLEIDGDNNNSNHNYIINGHIMSGLGDCEHLNNKFKRQNIYKEIV
jgi:hypothetical protein